MDAATIASAINADVIPGKRLMVVKEARLRYPFGTPRDQQTPEKAEGYSLQVGSATCFEKFNVKLPRDFDASSVQVGNVIELNDVEVGLSGKPEGDFVKYNVTVTASGVRVIPKGA